jgi:hypothetical protein
MAAGGRKVFAICGTRFRNESAAIREAGGEVWWIDRPGLSPGSHASDRILTADDCEARIVNHGTPEYLRAVIERKFAERFGSGNPPAAVAARVG